MIEQWASKGASSLMWKEYLQYKGIMSKRDLENKIYKLK
jgi:hypothetical protein